MQKNLPPSRVCSPEQNLRVELAATQQRLEAELAATRKELSDMMALLQRLVAKADA